MTSIPLRPVTLRLPHVGREAVGSRVRVGEAAVLLSLALVAVLTHGVNLFDFPYYHDDEGIYMAQAWAVASLGELAPYTYWYDHAPLGWILIAAWSTLTGGFDTFGTAVNSGRVLMVILHGASTLLVFAIGRSLTGRMWVGILAALLFTLNGYGLFWQRRVMLDNIAAFWMLVSIGLMVMGRPSLKRVWLSAVALGASVLSKEVTVFLIPAMSLLAYHRVHRVQRWFAAIGWPAIAGSLISLYILFAALKGELFPTGTLLGGDSEHVSLLGTLSWQAARGKDAGILQADSQFWNIINGNWIVYEPLLVVGGSLAAAVLLTTFRRDIRVATLGLMTFSLWAFMARGGIVYDQYLLPLVPLLALDVALIAWLGVELLVGAWRMGLAAVGIARLAPTVGRPAGVIVPLVAVMLTLPLVLTGYANPTFGAGGNSLAFWTGRQSAAQRQALDWVVANVPRSSSIIMDAGFYTDLHDLPDGGYPLAHHYFKVDLDPEIRDGVFEQSWRNVDYVMADATLKHQAEWDNLTIVLESIRNSTPILTLDTGWPVEVRRVNGLQQVEADLHPMLSALRLPPDASDVGTALLQAVYAGDERSVSALVDRIRDGAGADAGLALALLAADQRWEDLGLRTAADASVERLWASLHRSGDLLLPGAATADGLEVQVSELAPHVFRTLAAADPQHDWDQAADSVYALARRLSAYGLDPWTAGTVHVTDGRIVSASAGTDGANPLLLSMALDWVWNAEQDARTYLARAGDAPADSSGPDMPSVASDAVGDLVYRELPVMLASARTEEAAVAYASRILAPIASGALPIETDERMAEAAWLGVALMDGSMADLLDGERVIDWQSAMVVATGR